MDSAMSCREQKASPKPTEVIDRRISWSSSSGESSEATSTSWHSSNGGPLLGRQDIPITLSDCKPGHIVFMKKPKTVEELKRAAECNMELCRLEHPAVIIGVGNKRLECLPLTTTSGLTVQEKYPRAAHDWSSFIPIEGKPKNPDCACEPLQMNGKKMPKPSYIKWTAQSFVLPEMLTVITGTKLGDIRLHPDSLDRLLAFRNAELGLPSRSSPSGTPSSGRSSRTNSPSITHDKEVAHAWRHGYLAGLDEATTPPGASKLRVESWRNQNSVSALPIIPVSPPASQTGWHHTSKRALESRDWNRDKSHKKSSE
ncbi:hypothetical protein MMC11_008650 [Xylographa trunciseda]|nr:hypothetical protein [Xylographa trunciseda]